MASVVRLSSSTRRAVTNIMIDLPTASLAE
jgi:hypothetical protein